MARQKGRILLEGRIGDMVFYNTRRYGMVAREIGRVPKKVREEGASFEKPRRNNTEFGYGSKVGKLLRLGVKKCFKDAEMGDTNTRLTGRIKEVLAGDTNNEHGQRRITRENADLLTGFGWREGLTLHNVFWKPYSLVLDAEQGAVTLDIGPFRPVSHVKQNAGATHLEITLVLVAANHDKDAERSVCERSGFLKLGEDETPRISLTCSIPDYTDEVMVAGIGVQGYQEMNGKMWALTDRCVFEIVGAWVGC